MLQQADRTNAFVLTLLAILGVLLAVVGWFRYLS